LAGLDELSVNVLALDEDAAVALLDLALRAKSPRDDRISDDRGSAELLADRCGRLPLALRIAAALLRADPALGISGGLSGCAASGARGRGR